MIDGATHEVDDQNPFFLLVIVVFNAAVIVVFNAAVIVVFNWRGWEGHSPRSPSVFSIVQSPSVFSIIQSPPFFAIVSKRINAFAEIRTTNLPI